MRRWEYAVEQQDQSLITTHRIIVIPILWMKEDVAMLRKLTILLMMALAVWALTGGPA